MLELERLDETTVLELDLDELTAVDVEDEVTEQVPSDVNSPLPEPAVAITIWGTQAAESSL